jgi:hypothetical protein
VPLAQADGVAVEDVDRRVEVQLVGLRRRADRRAD